MTPRQRRNHIEALGKAAISPRKSWLGKSTLLTSIQSAWIKSLLSTWGEGVRGGAAPRMPRGHSCWNVIRGEGGQTRLWSGLQLRLSKREARALRESRH
jgi:hypothetical protein